MHRFLLLICIFLSFFGVLPAVASSSSCLNQKIEKFKNSAVCTTSATVKEFHFFKNDFMAADKTVYVFNPGSCGANMTSEVIDENCHSLGSLGGIAGNERIEFGQNVLDFVDAKPVRTIFDAKTEHSNEHAQTVDPSGFPPCIINLIVQTEHSLSSCGDEMVREYWFQNQRVYQFEGCHHIAESGSDIYDAKCKHLGFLGGIAGNTKINGDFFSSALEIGVVWQATK